MFSGGQALFPSDPLARVADRINRTTSLPTSLLEETITDIIQDEQGLPSDREEKLMTEIVDRLGIVPQSDCPSPITEKDITELKAIWNVRKEDFLKGVGFRAVRGARRQEDEPPK